VNFTETDEQQALRAAVAELGREYGYAYYTRQARQGGRLTELWQEAGKLGFLGVNLPAEYGGGGAGLYELAIVLEELATAGCGLLMMVVSPAICGTIIARYGTQEQQRTWLPLLASGAAILAFGITEPDAGDDAAAGEAANMAKYAAAEASVRTVDQAIQALGGSSMTQEFGLAAMLANVRTTRIAPVSREMILNFVAQHSLGLPKSY